MMPRKIFVTGITGTLGRQLLPLLMRDRNEITALVRPGETDTAVEGVRYSAGDIRDPRSYQDHIKRGCTVLHMAAITHSNSAELYHSVNAEATESLIGVCQSNKAARFIFISTRAIAPDGGAYSRSKISAERAVVHSGLDWTILRIAEVYGCGSKRGVDALIRSIGTMPIIPVIGNGGYQLAPVHIDDVVSAIADVLRSVRPSKRIYNISGPESVTYSELIDIICRCKKVKRIKLYIPLPIVRVAFFLLGMIRDSWVVKDQLPRLLCDKDFTIEAAVKDFGYNPVKIESWLNHEQI